MADEPTLETFAPHVGETFAVRRPGESDALAFELVEVLDLSERMQLPDEFRRPFRLSFRGPPGVVAPQDTYEIEHGEAGRHRLFLVPVLAPLVDGRRLHEVIVA